MKRFLLISFVFGFIAANSWAEDIRIVVPYVGTLTDRQDIQDVGEIDDTGFLYGLYFQWINPESYQWNAFVYHAPDVNYSNTVGGHFIYDYYLGHSPSGKFLVGGGLEALRVSMDAKDNLGTDDFDVSMTLLVPYLRVGKYFTGSRGPAQFSILPWVGVEPQYVWGDIEMKLTIPPMPQMVIEESIDDSALYAIAGLNLKVNLFHFLDLEGKYQATFDDADYFNTWNAIANVYLNRSWALSYRFKYMETSQGEGIHNYFGVAYVF